MRVRWVTERVVLKRFAFLFAAVTMLAACAQSDPVDVSNAWARATAGRTANAAIFMTIRSRGADRIVGASTPVAERTALMTMQSTGTVMHMVYVKGIDLPPGTDVQLDPAGLHVWLEQLKQPLTAGQRFPLTLRFEKAPERQVMVSVIGASAPAPPSGR